MRHLCDLPTEILYKVFDTVILSSDRVFLCSVKASAGVSPLFMLERDSVTGESLIGKQNSRRCTFTIRALRGVNHKLRALHTAWRQHRLTSHQPARGILFEDVKYGCLEDIRVYNGRVLVSRQPSSFAPKPYAPSILVSVRLFFSPLFDSELAAERWPGAVLMPCAAGDDKGFYAHLCNHVMAEVGYLADKLMHLTRRRYLLDVASADIEFCSSKLVGGGMNDQAAMQQVFGTRAMAMAMSEYIRQSLSHSAQKCLTTDDGDVPRVGQLRVMNGEEIVSWW